MSAYRTYLSSTVFLAPPGAALERRECERTGADLALLEQSQPGDRNVLVIDSPDVPRALPTDLIPITSAERTTLLV